LEAVRRSSSQTLYRRFFRLKRHFSEEEIAYFLNADFLNHVAIVAEIDENGKPAIVGSARYIVQEPGRAEVAFAVLDQYQGQGLGAAFMRHLAVIGRDAGLKTFTAEVLPENKAMLKVFQNSGLPLSIEREPGALHISLALA
jgi:RimJ/RimL family protein N-acetyltransferase